MFYAITDVTFFGTTKVSESNALFVWSSDESKIEKYIDWLNRNRDINHYYAKEIAETEWAALEERSDLQNFDEVDWDEFMENAQ